MMVIVVFKQISQVPQPTCFWMLSKANWRSSSTLPEDVLKLNKLPLLGLKSGVETSQLVVQLQPHICKSLLSLLHSLKHLFIWKKLILPDTRSTFATNFRISFSCKKLFGFYFKWHFHICTIILWNLHFWHEFVPKCKYSSLNYSTEMVPRP